MTPEEKAVWEIRRKDAKKRLSEIAPVRKKLKQLTDKYDIVFCREYVKFAEADERLSHEDGRYHKVTNSSKKTAFHSIEESLRKMSKEDILKLVEALQSQMVVDTGEAEDDESDYSNCNTSVFSVDPSSI